MTSSSRRRAKRSKTSSSVDLDTPTSDARNVDVNVLVTSKLKKSWPDCPVEEKISEPRKIGGVVFRSRVEGRFREDEPSSPRHSRSRPPTFGDYERTCYRKQKV
ncbi:hypothetical protein Hanom_Chr09g00784811 [Helianthus anomalus]